MDPLQITITNPQALEVTFGGTQGPAGGQGPIGNTGTPGPNQVTNATSTNLTGLLIGDGNAVAVASPAQVRTSADLDAALVTLRGMASTLIYTSGRLTSVTYADGSFRTLTYTGDRLTRVDTTLVNPNRTYRRTLTYTGDDLTSVTDTLLP